MVVLVVAYLGALAVLLLSAFWTTDVFTGEVVREPTLDNFRASVTTGLYRTVTLRTFGVAAAVTVICAVLAFPMAFFMAKVASPRTRRVLVVAVLTPLWASYLVKAYAWRAMLAGDGVVNWALDPFGLSGPGFGLTATVIVLAYLWLPFMILPIYAGLERLPDSLLEASRRPRRGGRAHRALGRAAAGRSRPWSPASIFTFSLSLGDYIAVQIVGGKSQLLGNLIQGNAGAANNLPLAAALAAVPVVIMVVYLLARTPHRRPGQAVSLSPRRAGRLCAAVTALGLAFVYVPLVVVLISSFNTDRTFGWPPGGLTVDWWRRAWDNAGAREALWTSVQAGLGATAIALVLGTMAAFAVARYRFFGRDVGVHPAGAADRAARHRHRHRPVQRDHTRRCSRSASTSACSPSSSGTPPSASWSSTTTCWPGCAGSAARWRRRRWTSAPTCSRRSGT